MGILVVAFLVTLVLLAFQWLHAGPPGGHVVGAPAPAHVSVLEVA